MILLIHLFHGDQLMIGVLDRDHKCIVDPVDSANRGGVLDLLKQNAIFLYGTGTSIGLNNFLFLTAPPLFFLAISYNK